MTSRSRNQKSQPPVSDVDDVFEGDEEFDSEESDKPAPSTLNDFGLMSGSNAVNHTHSMNGRGNFVHPIMHPVFRTKDAAFRFAAFLLTMAETLPNEGDEEYTFEEVLEAVRNS